MTWNATKTWAIGDLFTSGDANNILRDDVQYALDAERLLITSHDCVTWNNGGSTAYSDFGGASAFSMSFTKRQSSSDTALCTRAYGSCWFSATGSSARFGVSYGGTDVDGNLMFDNDSYHHAFCSFTSAYPLAAGTYTIKLRVKSVTGTPVINTDANDSATLEVFEVSLH